MTIVDPPPAAGPLKGGTLRALAVTSAQRHPSWPDLPTLVEPGMPEMDVPVWMALFAPARTPAPGAQAAAARGHARGPAADVRRASSLSASIRWSADPETCPRSRARHRALDRGGEGGEHQSD